MRREGQRDLGDGGSAAGSEAADRAVVAVLTEHPVVSVPPDFAARASRRALAQGPAGQPRWAGFGIRAAVSSGVLLTGALFAFAPHTAPSFFNLRFDLEMLLLAELGGVGYLVAQWNFRE